MSNLCYFFMYINILRHCPEFDLVLFLHFTHILPEQVLTNTSMWQYFRTKATRAKKLLQKKEALREEKRAAALAAGVEYKSDESDVEPPVRILIVILVAGYSSS